MHLDDDPSADAKSQAGTLAADLRGDERIELMRHDIGRDAGTAGVEEDAAHSGGDDFRRREVVLVRGRQFATLAPARKSEGVMP